MSIYEIKYYVSDYGGMRDELDKVEYFTGTKDEVIDHVVNTDTGWGFKFEPKFQEGNEYIYGGHGIAICKEVTEREVELVNKIAELETELAMLRGA